MNNISLKLKITLWYVLILVVVSFFILYAMTGLSQSIMVRDVENTVVSSVNELGRKVKEFPVPEMPNTQIAEHSLYNRGVQMAVYDKDGNIVFGYDPFGIVKSIDFVDDTLRVKKFNNKDYYFYDREVKIGEFTSYWVRGVACLTDETQSIQLAVKYNLLLIGLFVILAGLGGYVILGRALKPVSEIQMTAKEISESKDLSRRIGLESGEDELHSLATTFDTMLDKLQIAFEKEKQFTSDASHELRTPISVILSECEYAEECVETVEEYKEVIDSIKTQADKMSKLVSELLMISRMDNNRLKLNFEETDISELLNFVCDEQVEIQSKNITLRRFIEPNILCKIDRLLITRLFVNLISNAYKYSDENTEIKVSLYWENNKIIFSVKDEGIGISEENIAKIWNRFYQVDPSRSNDGSSGLGLSMVKWIADSHNGELDVVSEIGKGSTFYFILKN